MNDYAHVTGWGARQAIRLNPAVTLLRPDEIAAMISHECGHIRHGHRWQRVVWLFKLKWLNPHHLRALVWEQEYEADRHAVNSGHGDGLIRLLGRNLDAPNRHWHPPSKWRINEIRRLMVERKKGF